VDDPPAQLELLAELGPRRGERRGAVGRDAERRQRIRQPDEVAALQQSRPQLELHRIEQLAVEASDGIEVLAAERHCRGRADRVATAADHVPDHGAAAVLSGQSAQSGGPSQRMADIVDEVGLARNQRDLGLIHQDLGLICHAVLVDEVVGAEQLDQWGTAHFDDAVPVFRHRQRPVVALDPQPGVVRRFEDLAGAVGRVVVQHEDFHVLEGLREGSVQRLTKVPFGLIRRNAQ